MNRLLSRLPLFIFLFCLTSASIDYEHEYNSNEFTPEHSNEWVVRIDEGKRVRLLCREHEERSPCLPSGDEVADLVAKELGLENKRKVMSGEIRGV